MTGDAYSCDVQASRTKNIAAIVLAVAGAVAMIMAVAGNLQTLEPYMPARLKPYLPIVPAVCFVVALLALREAQAAPVDGVLYRENLQHRRKIAELEDELRSVRPREITHEQRYRIAERLEKAPKLMLDKYPYRHDIDIAPLSNAHDTRHLADAVREILQFQFNPKVVDSEEAWVTYYSMQNVAGIALLEPARTPYGRQDIQESRSRSAAYIMESFAAEGVAVERYPHPPLGNITGITILIGRRP